MSLKVFSFTVIFGLLPLLGVAQFSISGKVIDTEGKAIESVEIFDNDAGTVYYTDQTGTFLIQNLPAGTYQLFFFKLGLKTQQYDLTIVDSDLELDVKMQPLSNELTEVAVIDQRSELTLIKRLREVQGTSIFAGKKNEVIALDQMVVNVATNNARQIYSQVSGLTIFEGSDAGLQLNIGARGLDPNRSSNFNLRQNGYDISADVLGYPESYYTPPPEALRDIQIIRGAASLQYGTQFGGLVNFRMKKPNPNKNFELITRQSIGSNALFSSHNSVSGTKNKTSYLAYYNLKKGNGFRPNSEFESHNAYVYGSYQLSEKTELSADFTFLRYIAQQPGGLTDAQFYSDATQSNRTRNWFNVQWNLASVTLEHEFNYQTRFSVKAYGLSAVRKSVGFRTNRVSQQDDLDAPRDLIIGEFNNFGLESRFLHRYQIGEKNAVFLVGSKVYLSNNTSFQGPGSASSNADFEADTINFPNYPNQSDFVFPNRNLAFFGEHIIYLRDNFSITPGFRYEFISTQSDGSYKRINFDLAGNPIQNTTFEDNRSLTRNFLLTGLGLSYLPTERLEFFANISQNYRSVTFNDIRVVNPSFQVDPNINDEKGFTADIGMRGRLKNWLFFDAGVYALSYNNRIGEVLKAETRINAFGENEETGRVVRFRGNIGSAFVYGFESITDINIASLFNTSNSVKLNYFINTAVTQSTYIKSEIPGVKNNQVEFVPLFNVKTGVRFGYKNLLGSLQYTYVSTQFTDASNASQNVRDNQSGIRGEIPAYQVVDLSLSYNYKLITFETGINNLMNETYFTRRATGYPGPGIIPSAQRTWYLGVEFKF
ncbi:MAG: TonB-dependent receptor [Balneolaceae bacterium]|nr:TonB-dependent receptor [Balneolaceae bacterium]